MVMPSMIMRLPPYRGIAIGGATGAVAPGLRGRSVLDCPVLFAVRRSSTHICLNRSLPWALLCVTVSKV